MNYVCDYGQGGTSLCNHKNITENIISLHQN